ncbi:MAG: alpha/beta fold hydrolase [Chloroflexi bacterium]|nr:alpha/beta fold hydrolase [Chloroflexota bacterium]
MTRGPDSLVVTVDTGDQIHYLDWGGSRHPPSMVLVHGLAQTAWTWSPVARRLAAASRRVLAIDLRGHGLSDAPRHGYDLGSLAFDLLTVMAANDLDLESSRDPVVLCGHGFGAMIVAEAARLRPAAASAVALVDGGWENLDEATGLSPAEFLRGLAEPPEVLGSMTAFLADRQGYDPGTWDADQEQAARATVEEKHAGHVVPVTRRDVLAACVEGMFAYRPLEVLPAVAASLLVAVAETVSADDEMARERNLALEDVLRARVVAGLPAARVIRYAGAGHNLMRYRAAELSAELAALGNG